MRQANCSIERLAEQAGVTPTCVWYRMNFATHPGHIRLFLEVLDSPQYTPSGDMVEIELSEDDYQTLTQIEASWKERLSYALDWRFRDGHDD